MAVASVEVVGTVVTFNVAAPRGTSGVADTPGLEVLDDHDIILDRVVPGVTHALVALDVAQDQEAQDDIPEVLHDVGLAVHHDDHGRDHAHHLDIDIGTGAIRGQGRVPGRGLNRLRVDTRRVTSAGNTNIAAIGLTRENEGIDAAQGHVQDPDLGHTLVNELNQRQDQPPRPRKRQIEFTVLCSTLSSL